MSTLIHTIHTHMKRWKHDQRGIISVELALIATAVFFALLPLADIASTIYNSQQLSSSIRTAMQYAAENPDDTAGIESVAEANAGSLDTDAMSVTTSEFCECGGSVYGCNNSCAYGMQTYLSVSATYDQTLLVDYPGYGQQFPITKELTVRIE